MKKFTSVVFTALLVFLSNMLFSQAAGYMGKRLVVGYGFYFSPAVFGSNAAGSSIIGKGDGNSSTGELAFNSMHEAFAEVALKKRFSLGFSAKFYKTTYDNHQDLNANATVPDGYGSYDNVSYHGSPEGLYIIKGQNFALYGKLFNRSYIAPWGRYMMFGINVKRLTCVYDPAEMKMTYNSSSYYNTAPPFSDFGLLKQSYTRADLLFGLGRTRVIFNRVAIDYGFNLNVIALFATFFDNVTEDDNVFVDRVTNANYIKLTSGWRSRGVNRFNAFLKVGVLLF